MSKEPLTDAILIRNCPNCSRPHLYALAVERSIWMGASYVPVTPLKFTRLFTCPDTGDDFQVTMHLMQPHGIDYAEISIRGLLQVDFEVKDIPIATDFYKRGLVEKLKSHGITDSDLQVPPGGIEYRGLRILGIYEA